MGLTIKKRMQPTWYALIMLTLIGACVGMVTMYWLTDWGTHGYTCNGTQLITCTKEMK